MFRNRVKNAPGFFGVLAAMALLLLPFHADTAQAQRGKDVVSATATVSPSTAKPGDVVTVTVNATIDPKFHIYSVVEPKDFGPVPTNLTISAQNAGEATEWEAVGSVTETKPEIKFDPGFKTELGSHHGTASFTRKVRVPANASGTVGLTAGLRFQACTETNCLPPTTIEIPVPPLTVAKGTASAAADAKPQPVASPAALPTETPVAEETTLLGTRRSGRPKPVTATATVAPSPVRPGEIVTVTVNAVIDPEYHIYGTIPVENGPVPTSLNIEAEGWAVVGESGQSAPLKKFDKNFDKELGLHYKTATFTRQLRVPETATSTVNLTAGLRYQACTEISCLPPTTLDLEVPPLTVEAGAARAEYANPAVPPATGEPTTGAGDTRAELENSETAVVTKTESSGDTPLDGNLFGFILTGFAAGLLALITPCVFPMIPVTFAFFTKQASNTGSSIVKLASIYCLGIILAFTALGAIMAATVGAAGANRIAANPWVNLTFAALFIVFGLALLEVFELRLPSGLQNLSGKGRETGGTLGVLFMGLTFVIAAFTCTAPFIGTVLVAAASANSGADWVRPIVGMASFATALALPFFLLALFPGMLAKMPKSGSWLTTVKGALGFIEIGAALKFLSNADLVWQWQILTRWMILGLWVTVALAAAAWLLGMLHIGFNTPTGKLTVGRGISAGLFVALAVYCAVGLTGRPLPGLEGGFLPPMTYYYGYRGGTEGLPPAHKNDLNGALADAQAQNELIFVDFTGYTCGNCRWMEENIFTVPEVQAEIGKFTRAVLYTDEEKQKDDSGKPLGLKFQDYQEEHFGTIALPLYAVLRPDGTPVKDASGKPITFSYDTDPKEFIAFLQKAREAAR
ncbi:MAG: hypothetical protein OHK0029_03810 [Armatimonadaceae bacterium]